MPQCKVTIWSHSVKPQREATECCHRMRPVWGHRVRQEAGPNECINRPLVNKHMRQASPNIYNSRKVWLLHARYWADERGGILRTRVCDVACVWCGVCVMWRVCDVACMWCGMCMWCGVCVMWRAVAYVCVCGVLWHMCVCVACRGICEMRVVAQLRVLHSAKSLSFPEKRV